MVDPMENGHQRERSSREASIDESCGDGLSAFDAHQDQMMHQSRDWCWNEFYDHSPRLGDRGRCALLGVIVFNMQYPSGQEVRVGDLIWWDEGHHVGFVNVNLWRGILRVLSRSDY